MNDQKILFFALLVCIYFLYSVHFWFASGETSKESENIQNNIEVPVEVLQYNKTTETISITKRKPFPMYLKNACSIIEVFTLKPEKCKQVKHGDMESGRNSVTVIGITLFLLVLTVMAILDVIQVKEEERARRKLSPDEDRRQSLAEFANKNKKQLRRESSKLGLQLIHIQENNRSRKEIDDDETSTKLNPYIIGNSTNSYTDTNEAQDENPCSPLMGDPSAESKLVGSCEPSAGRRSSFPAFHISPDIQTTMLGHRQNSTDSDDEEKSRRVRFIRRF